VTGLSACLCACLVACSGAQSTSQGTSSLSTAPGLTSATPQPTAATAIASPTGAGSPEATAVPTPPVGGERATLTNADDGTMLDVRVNAVITVQLAAVAGYRWAPPAASDPALIARTAASQSPDGGATATFQTLAPGTAHLDATADPTCAPACKRLSQEWQVTIVVTPHPVP
jgi:hypothetical protein